MWILVVEALGALGLLLFIVWWTLGPTERREREALQQAARDAAMRATNATTARAATTATKVAPSPADDALVPREDR